MDNFPKFRCLDPHKSYVDPIKGKKKSILNSKDLWTYYNREKKLFWIWVDPEDARNNAEYNPRAFEYLKTWPYPI